MLIIWRKILLELMDVALLMRLDVALVVIIDNWYYNILNWIWNIESCESNLDFQDGMFFCNIKI